MTDCCQGCGRVDVAGITHVCPSVDGDTAPSTPFFGGAVLPPPIGPGSMWNLRSLADCLLATPKGATINEGLARDLARAALTADDVLRRLSEWDVLNLAPGSGDDGLYWQREIAKAREANG